MSISRQKFELSSPLPLSFNDLDTICKKEIFRDFWKVGAGRINFMNHSFQPFNIINNQPLSNLSNEFRKNLYNYTPNQFSPSCSKKSRFVNRKEIMIKNIRNAFIIRKLNPPKYSLVPWHNSNNNSLFEYFKAKRESSLLNKKGLSQINIYKKRNKITNIFSENTANKFRGLNPDIEKECINLRNRMNDLSKYSKHD